MTTITYHVKHATHTNGVPLNCRIISYNAIRDRDRIWYSFCPPSLYSYVCINAMNQASITVFNGHVDCYISLSVLMSPTPFQFGREANALLELQW